MAGRIAVLCGGVGAARLLRGLMAAVDNDQLTAIVNVGDDMELHGLHISPDIDTIVYTLSGQVSTERGWGLEGETWQAMDSLGRYGGENWFNLGDRDLGTHLYRTNELKKGQTLSAVTQSIATAWNLGFNILPVTDDRVRTMVTTQEEGEISFQEYFVRLQHNVAVSSVRFEGADAAVPGPGVLEALGQADRIIIAPSNPIVSIDPILAVPGVAEAIRDRRADTVAVSPIIGGAALKGPADRLLIELGRESSALGVAKFYSELAASLVIDTADHELANQIREIGVSPVVTYTVMAEPGVTESLTETLLSPTLFG